MKLKYLSGLAALILLATVSCKNETEAPVEVEVVEEKKIEAPRIEKKPLTKEDREILGSVMMKLMATPEAKSFVSSLVTVQLTDLLSKDQGPYTVFVPTAAAFDSIPQEVRKVLFNQSNKEQLANLLKAHIVKENISSSQLVQNIKEKGSYSFKTIGGTTLTATMAGSAIYIKNDAGTLVSVGKSDIQANNGVVHLVDGVLLDNR